MNMDSNSRLGGLVVDDDAAIRYLAADILSARGCRVITAGDALEAVRIALAQKCAIDFLVTDYELGGASGIELAANLRRLFPDISVLLMSGRNADDIPKASAADGFLSKPFSPASLCDSLQRALTRSDTAQRRDRP